MADEINLAELITVGFKQGYITDDDMQDFQVQVTNQQLQGNETIDYRFLDDKEGIRKFNDTLDLYNDSRDEFARAAEGNGDKKDVLEWTRLLWEIRALVKSKSEEVKK